MVSARILGAPSSVGSFDADDQMLVRLEDVEHKAEDTLEISHANERTLQDLERRREASYTLGQLSVAMKKQFATITKDRDTLADRIESDRPEQVKINRAHDADAAGLRDEIQMLKVTPGLGKWRDPWPRMQRLHLCQLAGQRMAWNERNFKQDVPYNDNPSQIPHG
ncbi:hypothetical protein B0H13DRAFT_1910430 [Mycena leptocephala]|nr:hypothetical protein B0H13DRAFT_1910430 [Mycena leptocephala]